MNPPSSILELRHVTLQMPSWRLGGDIQEEQSFVITPLKPKFSEKALDDFFSTKLTPKTKTLMDHLCTSRFICITHHCQTLLETSVAPKSISRTLWIDPGSIPSLKQQSAEKILALMTTRYKESFLGYLKESINC